MWIVNKTVVEGACSHFIIILLLLLCGCSRSSMIPLQGMEANDVRQSLVGVVILIPEKKIEFSEHLYRALTNEVRENFYSYEGIWDPMPILQKVCMKALEGRFHLKPVPLWVALEQTAYINIVSDSEAAYNAARTRIGPDAINGVSSYAMEWSNAPPRKYLSASPGADMLALQRLGLDLVLEVSIHGIVYNRHGSFIQAIAMAYARLIRLSDGSVVWADRGVGGGKIIRGVKSFTELEANDLALIKKHSEEALMSLFGQQGSAEVERIFDRLPTE